MPIQAHGDRRRRRCGGAVQLPLPLPAVAARRLQRAGLGG